MDFWTGIIVCFDEKSTQKLKELQKILIDSPDIHSQLDLHVPPHITILFKLEDLRNHEIYNKLEDVISNFMSFSLEFSGFTTFPSTHVFYLNPNYSTNLQSLRKLCLESLENQGVVLDRKPDSMWSPHVTLLMDLPTQEISKAVDISQKYLDLQIEKPFVVDITHIALFSYPPYKTEKEFFLGSPD